MRQGSPSPRLLSPAGRGASQREAEIRQSVRIEAIAAGGEGIASLPSGKRAFIPWTAPGDLVSVEVVEERARHAKGRLVQVIEAGPGRVAPRCPHHGVCGGCALQHLAYEEELRAKERIFYDALERIGGFPRGAVERPLAILPSPSPWRYRSRCRLQVQQGQLGYRERGSHAFVPIGRCDLLAPPLEALALAVGRWLRAHPVCAVSAVELCVGPGGEGAVALHPSRPPSAAWWVAAAGLLQLDGIRGIVVPAGERWAERVFGNPLIAWPAAGMKKGDIDRSADAQQRQADVSIYHRPDLFAQANAAGNRLLVERAVGALRAGPGQRVLELYCGAGNFSFALAARGAKVLAVEGAGRSIELARRAADAAPAPIRGRLRFVSGEVRQVVDGLAREGQRFDGVFLDPPRSGAKGLMEAVARLQAPRIVYVSCDPPTLARDLAQLRARGYRLVEAQPVDMFPRTQHLEGIAVLEAGWKRGS